MSRGSLEKRAAICVETVVTRRPAILPMAHAQRAVLLAGWAITATKVNISDEYRIIMIKEKHNLHTFDVNV